jgi:hypothetical protein
MRAGWLLDFFKEAESDEFTDDGFFPRFDNPVFVGL